MELLRELVFIKAAASAVLGAGLLLAALGARRSAAWRSGVLATSFVAVFLLPALLPVLPAPTRQESSGTVAAAPVAMADTRETGRSATSLTEGFSSPVARRSDWILPVGIALYAAGLVLGGTRLARAHHLAWKLTRSSRPARSPVLQGIHWELQRERSVNRPVRLAVCRDLRGPITVGWLRPVILLPSDAENWSRDQTRDVLRHEWAHVARLDNAVILAARIVVLLHWFDPLARLARGVLERNIESACDDEVVRLTARPSVYARILLAGAQSTPHDVFLAPAVASFASHVSGRLRRVLNQGADRRPCGRSVSLATAVLLLAVTLPLTALRPPVLADQPRSEIFSDTTPEKATPTGPPWWEELKAELREVRAVNAWKRGEALGTPLPEGVFRGLADGWTVEIHDAVFLPGTKHGCLFTSDEGYVRIRRDDGSEPFAVEAMPHPPVSALEATVDEALSSFGLGTYGDFRAYRISGWRNPENLQRFQRLLTLVTLETNSRSPAPTNQKVERQ